MSQPSIEIRALELFAAGHKLSRAELRKALGLPADKEITSRIRAIRTMGFEIVCSVERLLIVGDGRGVRRERVYRYEMPVPVRERALLYLTERRAK